MDYYALGVLLYELLVGVSPFSAKTKAEIYYAALNHEVKFPKDVALSKEVRSLLTGLLDKNPSRRIGSLDGVREILLHPWVAKKGAASNSFSGRVFKEYREVREPDAAWLEAEFQAEKKPYAR